MVVVKPASIELGPYQLLELIGEGGNGHVFRATGERGLVAIKLLGPANLVDEAARARFRREITALGELSHPHLIPLLDHGVDGELGPYLVVPLLAGTNLRVLCGRGAMCPEAALLLIQPIVEATAALHAAGFVHRDLKPENVIAGPDGSITVIDLGLAWGDGMTRHTDTGAAVGSIGYMSPEQIEAHPVDDRADVWALGVMLYEWIVGARPFARPRASEEAAAMLLGRCPRLTAADRRASEDLADLVARMLALAPANRPLASEVAVTIAAMIDWTDSIPIERAAVVANPTGYQARIAPFRVRRLERLARDATEHGKPFVALGYCDRGLAYASDHAGLLALVSTAEISTARSESATEDAAAPPPSLPSRARVPSTEGQTWSESANAGERVRPAIAAPTALFRARWSKRWPWILVALLGIAVGAIAVYVVVPDRGPRDAWSTPGPTRHASEATPAVTPGVTPKVMTDDDRNVGLAKDFLSLMGQVISDGDRAPRPSSGQAGQPPTTATGWLDLASSQSPQDALVSIRHALVLAPDWSNAQAALCAALAVNRDAGAIEACNVAIARRPSDVALLAARGSARLEAGHPGDALVDLDRVVAADPDPKWRRLRSRARTAAGDRKGAKHDLDQGCQLGDAIACHDAKLP